jgi:thiamine biosynthesis lipoprotein
MMMILSVVPGELPPFKRLILPLIFVGALFVVLANRPSEPPFVTIQFNGETMGTTYMVKVVVPSKSKPDPKKVSAAIESTLTAVNRSMSTYIADSELSVFNQSRSTEPRLASDALRFVMAEALTISRSSSGAFDPTVGPLVNAWGFGPKKRKKAPTDAEIALLKTQVGYAKLSLDEKTKTVAKGQPELYVDLSAIAKGYGVDRISELLHELGLSDHLVEIGGEVRSRGQNRRRVPWRLAIQRPVARPGETHQSAIISLGTGAMATSGDYRNYYESEGRRISHTIDPRTGRPIRHALASVTVVSDTCAHADGWATALNVLGPDHGYILAEKLGMKAFFLVRNPQGRFHEKETTAFALLRSKTTNRPKAAESGKVKP